jgi:dTDP-4-dehydrorhamnose 3,5-epimerase
MLLVIPAGVVHAYQNVGTELGLVYNFPNRLYKGPGRAEPVDEIRHEADPESPYRLE